MRKELTAIAIGVGFIALVGLADTAFRFLPLNTENGAAIITKYGTMDETIEAGLKHFAGLNAKVVNVQKRTWGGYVFETGVLKTRQYRTDGNKTIQFTDTGWYAPSFSMPRSKLLDVNLNQKNKVRIIGTFEGKMESPNTDCTGHCMTTERYHFSEFAIYLIDENGHKQGMRVLGTRNNVTRGNNRSKYKFTELAVENTGKEIIVIDNTGDSLAYSMNFKQVTAEGSTEPNRGGNYGTLNPNQKWVLGINCHVNGEGYCKLDIRDVVADK
ncbi:MAG: hypothetical protein G01um101417_365 [Parcubacteria group bacterium Gr01-1014_17]|nr:MAG: hypothetical protein G01um101417_365 [Parcubacteria group bacterium Gr01-1014_17]